MAICYTIIIRRPISIDNRSINLGNVFRTRNIFVLDDKCTNDTILDKILIRAAFTPYVESSHELVAVGEEAFKLHIFACIFDFEL